MNALSSRIEAPASAVAAAGARPALWINGRWQEGSGEDRLVHNPANGEQVAAIRLAAAPDFARAIDGAEHALNAWRRVPQAARGAILRRAAELLLARKDQIARLLTLEQGKPLAQAAGEVDYAASFFFWFAEEARRLHGRIQAHPVSGWEYRITPLPAGIAGLVTPWNFPLAQGAKKLAAALAAGCTAVWKPSELTPLVALALGPLLQEAGLPDGVLQVLPALGAVGGEALTRDSRIRVLSLTGSTATGRWLMQAAEHLPRLSFELGGNAPFIVLPDADLDFVVEELVKLKLLCSGQVCVTANRIFVPHECEAKLIEKLARCWSRITVGNGLDVGVDAGPLIHRTACERVRLLVQDAVAGGAEIVAENRSHERNPSNRDGSFHPPAVLRGVRDEMAIARTEIFGPVAPLLTYRDVTKVIRRANSTATGLAGYVYGRDASRARAVAAELEVGIVGINEWRPLRAEIPFGGVKASGLGWEGGEEGLREFCVLKVIAAQTTVTDLA